MEQAILNRDLELIKELIAKGERLNNYINIIININDFQFIKYLINEGLNVKYFLCSVFCKDTFDYAIPEVITTHVINLTKFILENYDIQKDFTIFYYACLTESLELVKLFTDKYKYCDINLSRILSSICLNNNGSVEIVKFLRNKISNIHSDNDLILHSAIEGYNDYKKMDLIQYLISEGCKLTIKDLLISIEKNNFKLMVFILSQGVDINEQEDWLSYTPLMKAINCYKGDLSIIQYLVDNGADVNFSDQCEHSVLSLAIIKGDIDVFNFLIDKGINLNIGTDIFVSQISENSEKIFNILKEKGSNIKIFTDPVEAMQNLWIKSIDTEVAINEVISNLEYNSPMITKTDNSRCVYILEENKRCPLRIFEHQKFCVLHQK